MRLLGSLLLNFTMKCDCIIIMIVKVTTLEICYCKFFNTKMTAIFKKKNLPVVLIGSVVFTVQVCVYQFDFFLCFSLCETICVYILRTSDQNEINHVPLFALGLCLNFSLFWPSSKHVIITRLVLQTYVHLLLTNFKMLISVHWQIPTLK